MKNYFWIVGPDFLRFQQSLTAMSYIEWQEIHNLVFFLECIKRYFIHSLASGRCITQLISNTYWAFTMYQTQFYHLAYINFFNPHNSPWGSYDYYPHYPGNETEVEISNSDWQWWKSHDLHPHHLASRRTHSIPKLST